MLIQLNANYFDNVSGGCTCSASGGSLYSLYSDFVKKNPDLAPYDVRLLLAFPQLALQSMGISPCEVTYN